MTYYEVLGVDRNANEKAIKAAHRKLSKKWHPDTAQARGEEEEFAKKEMQEINEAYATLIDPKKRAMYDAQNLVSTNVYEYYAKKQNKEENGKEKTNVEIEKEKQRKAVLQFLDVEFQHKNEILEMFAELATGAMNYTFSEEEYLEYRELILEEQQDCIKKIQEIAAVTKKKQITGLEENFRQAEKVVKELTRKGNEAPKSLKEAHYMEETRILTKKIHNLMNGFRDRVNSITGFDLLDKTWEFTNDEELNSVREAHKNEVIKLLSDIQWIQETASARKIKIGLINMSNSRKSYDREEITLDECKSRVEKCKQVLDLNLQGLREKFWKERCRYVKDETGKTVLDGMKSIYQAEQYEGNFICPPNIEKIRYYALYWLKNIHSISIPAHLINTDTTIELPNESALKHLIFTFDKQQQVVDISKIDAEIIIKKGDYICVSGGPFSNHSFALVDEKCVYIYDNKKLCKLSDVKSINELKKLSSLWRSYSDWENCQLQIHAWAQVTKKLPYPELMRYFPTSTEFIKEWVKLDKTNFDNAFLASDEKTRTRVIRLYIALGALNGDYCHAQAEWLISRLDVSKMYRSRLERSFKEVEMNQDPMFYVQTSAVNLIQENINNQEFLPYIFAFLEGNKMFQTEAKKTNVALSPEFIMKTAPQYIFHKKVDVITDFVKELFEAEQNIEGKVAEKILDLYNVVQRKLGGGLDKNIITTVDKDKSSTMHYRFFDIGALGTYLAFAKSFYSKEKSQKSNFYGVEAENVFLSSNSHAIEIVDGENKRIATVILNLFDEGELFADIMSCENESIEVLEAIRRALIDQKNCNNIITGISIGMNEPARTTRYNNWRRVIQNANEDWARKVKWIKFEYLFKSQILSISYKGYRARFILEGKEQNLNTPNPYDDPRVSSREERSWW